jgi:hypothetical protein
VLKLEPTGKRIGSGAQLELVKPSRFLPRLATHVAMFSFWQNQSFPHFPPVKALALREINCVSCELAIAWLKLVARTQIKHY